MLYEYPLTVTAGTTKASPAKVDMVLTKGVIHRVEVEFYPGPRRYVEARIRRGGHQVWPTNPDGSFCSDGHRIVWDENYEITTQPVRFKFEAWSPDADYNHVIVCRISLLESRTAILLLRGLKGILRLVQFFGIKV